MVGTQLIADACNKEHKSKVLAESDSLKTLEEKLERLCTLKKSKSASAMLSGQNHLVTEVETPEGKSKDVTSQNWKCTTCQRIHKWYGVCKRVRRGICRPSARHLKVT